MYLLCLNVSSGSAVVIAHYTYVQTYEYFIVDVYCLECFVFDSFEGSFLFASGNCFIHWSRSCHVLRDSSNWPLLIGSGVSTELKSGQSESFPDFFELEQKKEGLSFLVTDTVMACVWHKHCQHDSYNPEVAQLEQGKEPWNILGGRRNSYNMWTWEKTPSIMHKMNFLKILNDRFNLISSWISFSSLPVFVPVYLCTHAYLGQGCFSARLTWAIPSHSCFCWSQRKAEGTLPQQDWDKGTLPYFGQCLTTFILMTLVFYFPQNKMAESSGALFCGK